MDGVAILEREVRELIRRRGIDPERDSGDLALIVREAVEDYDRRSGRGVVPALADADGATREIVAAVAGMGPLQPYLDDPQIEEIWACSANYVTRSARSGTSGRLVSRILLWISSWTHCEIGHAGPHSRVISTMTVDPTTTSSVDSAVEGIYIVVMEVREGCAPARSASRLQW